MGVLPHKSAAPPSVTVSSAIFKVRRLNSELLPSDVQYQRNPKSIELLALALPSKLISTPFIVAPAGIPKPKVS